MAPTDSVFDMVYSIITVVPAIREDKGTIMLRLIDRGLHDLTVNYADYWRNS